MSNRSPGSAARPSPAARRVRNGRGRDPRRLAGSAAAAALGGGLALFHGQLLWQRVASATLFEPLVAVRWSAAALLLAGLLHQWRSGLCLARGSRPLVFWLLVLLLHAGAAPAVLQPLAEPGLWLGAALWGFALHAAYSVRRSSAGSATRTGLARARATPCFPCGPGFYEPLSPRPPPAP